MSDLQYVDVPTARAARGVRLVVSGLVPSPWSVAREAVGDRVAPGLLAHRRCMLERHLGWPISL